MEGEFAASTTRKFNRRDRRAHLRYLRVNVEQLVAARDARDPNWLEVTAGTRLTRGSIRALFPRLTDADVKSLPSALARKPQGAGKPAKDVATYRFPRGLVEGRGDAAAGSSADGSLATLWPRMVHGRGRGDAAAATWTGRGDAATRIVL